MKHQQLLTIGNPKTAKGVKYGYHTAVLHLVPYKAAGINVCPMAELAGCIAGCLNTAGRGGIPQSAGATFDSYGTALPDNAIQRCRVRRTRYWAEDRQAFLDDLIYSIRAVIRQADRKNLIPAIRLNGTSDIRWECIRIASEGNKAIFDVFPDVQFYDYTKIAKRFNTPLPANYALTMSYSEASERYADMAWGAHWKGASLIIVTRDEATKARYMAQNTNTIDGDEHDLRFLDPPGSLVYLKAKGRAKQDASGFVLD